MSDWECKVCGATPDDTGTVHHGRGCFVASEDGGGETSVDLPEKETMTITPSDVGTINAAIERDKCNCGGMTIDNHARHCPAGQFDRLKALFDEMGVPYEVSDRRADRITIVISKGVSYEGVTEFRFDRTGKFIEHGCWI